MQQTAPISPEHAEIAAMRGAGSSMKAIADKIGCDKSTISRIASRPQIKELIESANNEITTKAMVNVIDRVVLEQDAALHLTKHLINGEANATKIKGPAIGMFLDRTTKTGNEVLKSVGVFASHSQNIMIQNIYNDNSKTILSPIVLDMLQGKLNDLTESIDAEIVE